MNDTCEACGAKDKPRGRIYCETCDALRDATHRLWREEYPKARIQVKVQVLCPAMHDTRLLCEKFYGHRGRHFLYTKQLEFDYDHREQDALEQEE